MVKTDVSGIPTLLQCNQIIYIYNGAINDFKIMCIVQLRNPPTRKEEIETKLEELEGYWKFRLNTLKPFGLNIIDEYASSTGKRGIMMEFL